MRDSPWFHPKRSESAPPAQRVREAPAMTPKEQDDVTARVSRPTESALYRKSLFWKLDGFMNRGFHSWSKMELFDDCKRCMWGKEGAIKPSCKIRPLNKNLPPLARSRDDLGGPCESQRSVCSTTTGSCNGDNIGQSRSQCRGITRSGQSQSSRFGSPVVRIRTSGLSGSFRGLSRERTDFGRSRTELSNPNTMNNFGHLQQLKNNGYRSNGLADLAVPRISTAGNTTRPVATVGQR